MDKSPDAFRTISEVAEVLETPAHVLRFWESRFPQIRPVKRAGGRRYYRPSDVALLAGIRRLLHDEGMTIRGVQKVLREQGVRHVAGLAGDQDAVPDLDIDLDALLEDGAEDAADSAADAAAADARDAAVDRPAAVAAAPAEPEPAAREPAADAAPSVRRHRDRRHRPPPATTRPASARRWPPGCAPCRPARWPPGPPRSGRCATGWPCCAPPWRRGPG
ncbi:MAG TPA: MerR family transcriptional regulator [Paracoccaceae bacterium]|nr:MerR family transcriptional regulator [Paracoccaceae bacterium]